MTDLFETTMQQVRDSGMSLPKIASGAQVGHRWLVDLMNGRFNDPGVKKIQRLHAFLSQQKKAA